MLCEYAGADYEAKLHDSASYVLSCSRWQWGCMVV
jgi:hypothetical protein